jgi:hypothetical protein
MGKGRADAPFKDNSYIAALMVIATAQPADAGATFRWTRLLTRRKWFIRKNAAGTAWDVTKENSAGTVAPVDDTGSDIFNTRTPSATLKLYIYDNAGSFLGGSPLANGDFSRQEKDFTYRLEKNCGGGVWVRCFEIHVGQVTSAKRIDTTGTVATDFQGIENSYSLVTLDCIITEAEVRALVGGALPINIAADANN